VSSAAMTVLVRSASIRRVEASPRFPMGVAARMIMVSVSQQWLTTMVRCSSPTLRPFV